MRSLIPSAVTTPAAIRVVPFLLFLGLTFLQGRFGEESRYWFYLAKTILGAWMIYAIWPWVTEMRWRVSWEGVLVGVAVFGVWVGLDGLYPSLDALLQKVGLGKAAARETLPWNPLTHFAATPWLGWLFVGVRIAGSALVVPPLEEVFYRSFLYRYIAKADFQAVPLGHFAWLPFLVTSTIFGFAHYEWLAGILCGMAYQGLVIWKKRLGDAMTAHAITNLLLGIWVVWKGAWNFW